MSFGKLDCLRKDSEHKQEPVRSPGASSIRLERKAGNRPPGRFGRGLARVRLADHHPCLDHLHTDHWCALRKWFYFARTVVGLPWEV